MLHIQITQVKNGYVVTVNKTNETNDVQNNSFEETMLNLASKMQKKIEGDDVLQEIQNKNNEYVDYLGTRVFKTFKEMISFLTLLEQ